MYSKIIMGLESRDAEPTSEELACMYEDAFFRITNDPSPVQQRGNLFGDRYIEEWFMSTTGTRIEARLRFNKYARPPQTSLTVNLWCGPDPDGAVEELKGLFLKQGLVIHFIGVDRN